MKRVSFIFVILSLALGLQAQTNPKIASLVDKVYSIEGSHVTFVCAYNGTYYESVTVFVESNPDARSFKFANDSITQLTDSLKRLNNQAARPVYDAIRKTCRSLAQDAEESNLWEYHHDGTDSIKYAIMLKNGGSLYSLNKGNRRLIVDTFQQPLFPTLAGQEALKYEYNPMPRSNPQHYEHEDWPLKGQGQFDYRYDVDTVRGEIDPFDKKDYSRRIDRLLRNVANVTSRSIHLSHDSIISISSPNYFSPTLNNMAFYVNSTYDKGEYDEQNHWWAQRKLRPTSESKGMLYTTHSKELADSLLQQIVLTTKEYLKEHPHIRYKFYPKVRYEEALCPVFSGENGSGAVEDFRIFVHRDQNNEYHILTFDTKGELWIPLTWPELKTWKNGEATYYSRRMSEIEYSIYTRSREKEERTWDSPR